MNLKKAALILLAAVVMSTLVACSPHDAAGQNPVTTTSAPQTAEAVTAEPESPTVTAEQSEAVSDETAESSEAAEAPETSEASETTEAAAPDSGALGDYTVSILKYDLTEDYEGNSAIRVYFEFTNNGEDDASFMFAVNTQAFQNGIELETAIVLDSVEEDDNAIKDIKPGVKITCTQIFALSDTSPVTVEASELISFSDDKLTKTFDIAE